MALAAKIPYDHPYAGGFPGLGGQALPTDSDCLTYLAAVKAADGAGVEVGVAVAVDAFFRGLKATPGLFDAIKASCILCGARTLAGALVPVVGDAPTNVADGFVEGDYSRTAGITGDGTSYIDSGRANNADPEDDKHMAVYATTLASSGVNAYMGGYLVSPSRFSQLIRPGAATTFNSSINDATGVTLDLTQPGLICASRDGTSVHRRADDVTDVASSATTGNPNFSILVFSRNALGSPDSTSDATLAFYSIGTAISDLAAFEDSLDNLITAIGEAL